LSKYKLQAHIGKAQYRLWPSWGTPGCQTGSLRKKKKNKHTNLSNAYSYFLSTYLCIALEFTLTYSISILYAKTNFRALFLVIDVASKKWHQLILYVVYIMFIQITTLGLTIFYENIFVYLHNLLKMSLGRSWQFLTLFFLFCKALEAVIAIQIVGEILECFWELST